MAALTPHPRTSHRRTPRRRLLGHRRPLALGLAASALPGLAALALASNQAYASEAPPAGATTTTTETTTAPATTTTTEAPPYPSGSGQPQTPPVPAPVTTTTAAPGGPEVVKQHSQPRGRQPVPPGAAGKGSPSEKEGPRSQSGGTPPGTTTTAAGLSHAPALAPGALTPPLPPSLSGSLGSVPSFFVDTFSIPPFLLPIYQAAGAAYGIPWPVLAAINEVETDYGRDLNLSSAGAEGWMQFLPGEWSQFGVDVNNDGFKDPYNPADAIFAAARYLRDAGGQHDIRAAVFAYNHSQAYVRSVMLRARLLTGTPPALLGAVTGLSEARFPVFAPSHFSDGFSTSPTGATLVGTTIYSRPQAPAVAVQDGRIVRMGSSPQLGRFISLRDMYGNTYTYAQLGALASLYPVLEGSRRFSLHPLHTGAHVIAGTVLGRLAGGSAGEPHVLFEIRPAGAGAPLIDPKPVLDGWVKLQNSSAIRLNRAGSPVPAGGPTPGQVLLESKAQLERQIARERRLRVAACERRAIASGLVDRRVLAALQFLASSGLVPSVSASSCASSPREGAGPAQRGAGRRLFGARGSASAGLPAGGGGPAIDIGAINGMAVSGEGGGATTLALAAVRRLLSLQGTMRPTLIAGPAGLPRRARVLRLAGRPHYLRVSFGASAQPAARISATLAAGLSPVQWVKLIARLGQIPDPAVPSNPSSAAIPDGVPAQGGRG